MIETSERSAADSHNEAATDVVADFAATVRAWPYRAATMYNGTTVSYRELAARVRANATHYQTCVASAPSRLIRVEVSHTPAVVEHLLGILRAGATFCPIDAALPAARKQQLADVLGLHGLPAEAGAAPLPADLAYAICTSGSTGAPKPVLISRCALGVTVHALKELFALTPDDRVLQFSALGWDTCLEEILPALIAGATVVFDDAAHSHSFPRFLRMLAQRKVTVLDLPTAFWHELVLFLYEERAALPDTVRLVVIGGERVDVTRLRQWRGLATGQVRLLNTYGCTETTMVTHAVQLSGPGTEPEIAACANDAPLGRALSHVRDHITDDGELLVSGPGLASGYLGLPEQSRTGFPIIDQGNGPVRWFRTGDVVTRGTGGLLFPRGRIDDQVKVLGVRIDPAEVEAQLTTHPAVGGAVVTGERRLGRTTLAAYVVPVGETTPGELKQYLRQRLPSQFIPSTVTLVAALSYTASGKVDRAATQRAAANHISKGADR